MPEDAQDEASYVDAVFTKNNQIELLAITMDLMHAQMTDALDWGVSLEQLATEYCTASVEEHRTSLARLAAHMAVRNQVMSFAVPGIDEETHTAALFGMLANTLSLATVLSPHQTGGNVAPQNAGCYWAHQSKITEEPKSGIDFGIITDLSKYSVKLTVFQAKRQQSGKRLDHLEYHHTVRRGKLTEPKIVSARIQKEILSEVIEWIKEGCSLHSIACRLEELGKSNAAILTGPQSLFSSNHSYQQITAFLATELRGEIFALRNKRYAKIASWGWCFYSQWPYGERGVPWVAPIIDVLRKETDPDTDLSPIDFSDILSLALSPETDAVGLIIPKGYIKQFAHQITGLMPNITWGVVSDSEDGARELTNELSSPTRQFRQTKLPSPAQAAPQVGRARKLPGPSL